MASLKNWEQDRAILCADKPLPPWHDIPLFPLPGVDSVRLAASLAGKTALLEEAIRSSRLGHTTLVPDLLPQLDYVMWHELYVPGMEFPVWRKGQKLAMPYVSGDRFGLDDSYGPMALPEGRWPEVMVIGKHPGRAEVSAHTNFVGPASADFERALQDLDVEPIEVAAWYVTNVVKHENPDPTGGKRLDSGVVANGVWLLWAEIFLLRPKFILCLGAEAIQAILGRGENVSKMLGRVVEQTFCFDRKDGTRDQHVAKVMGIVHPAQVFRKPEMYSELRDGLGQFLALTRGEAIGRGEEGLEHKLVYSERELAVEVDHVIASYQPEFGGQPIAIDAEWHGKYPTEMDSYIRTFQFSHRPKYACCVVLRDIDGQECFEGGLDGAQRQLVRLLKSTPDREVRVGGQFVRADLPWVFKKLQIDLSDEFAPAATPADTKYHGGFDTGYLAHAIREDMGKGGYTLEVMASRFCRIPRYDVELDAWVHKYKKELKAKGEELIGYGSVPDEILLGERLEPSPGYNGIPVRNSYACYDADACMRLFLRFNGVGHEPGELDADEFGLNSREAALSSQRASRVFLEMEDLGLVVDRSRAGALSYVFQRALRKLTQVFRRKIRWHRFNPRSDFHCRELLFGTALNGKRDKETNAPVRLRPDWVTPRPGEWPAHPELANHQPVSMGLGPIKVAGLKGKTWGQLTPDDRTKHNPSVDKTTLGILSHTSPLVRELRDIRFLEKALQSVIREPECGPDGMPILDANGEWVYSGGLMSWAHHDGAIRTHFFPVETGRCSSSRPNIQNVGKAREADYEAILGVYRKDKTTGEIKADGRYLDILGRPLYKYPMRSVMRSRTGKILVEADYKGAELAVLAWQANCKQMIEDVRRNQLPEDHPDFLDLHSQMAVAAFHLNCAPTKKGLASIGKAHIRTGAKSIIFGTAYGISPKAVALKCREEGISLTDADAEAMQDAYFDRWPENRDYLDACAARVSNPGWICMPFGRYRRFHWTDDESVLAEMQRQAFNCTIQGGVAGAIEQAMHNLYCYRKQHAESGGCHWFNFALQIHDAILFECDPDSVPFLLNAIRICMLEQVPFIPRRLDGTIRDDDPYYFGVDVDMYEHWGVKLSADQAMKLGLPDAQEVRRLLTLSSAPAH